MARVSGPTTVQYGQIDLDNNRVDLSLHRGKCGIVGPHVHRALHEFFAAKVSKYETAYVEHKAIKHQHKAELLRLQEAHAANKEQGINIGGIEITDEQIEQIKEAIAKAVEFLSKLKDKKKVAQANLDEMLSHIEFDQAHLSSAVATHQHLGEVVAEAIHEPGIALSDLAHDVGDFVHDLGEKLKLPGSSSSSSAKPHNPVVVYDAHNTAALPGLKVYQNWGGYDLNKVSATIKERVTLAFNNTWDTLTFWKSTFNLDSYDNHAIEIDAVVRFMKNYVNAFFNGKQMVYGDGNKYFNQFVKYLDVAGHEMWHAVTGDRLNYQGQSGALNEHYSDVMGLCLELWKAEQLGQPIAVKDFHWLVGNGLITYKGQGYALRSFIAPGTAYNIPPLGKDPQPADFTGVDPNMTDDNGGVHIYSGIPNHVFYLVSMHFQDWKGPAHFWKDCLDTINNPDITFAEFAAFQIKKAQADGNSEMVAALTQAWDAVKVPYRSVKGFMEEDESLAAKIAAAEEEQKVPAEAAV